MRKRNPRVDGAVREAVASILEDSADPRLNFVTVTEVEVSQDTKRAIVYYTALDPDVVSDERNQRGDHLPEAHEVATALDSARGHIQSELAQRVRLRNTPKLEFVPDPVAEQASKVEELLRQVRRGEAG